MEYICKDEVIRAIKKGSKLNDSIRILSKHMLEDIEALPTFEAKRDIDIKLDDGAYMPVRGHETDAGLDIRAMERQIVPAKESAIFKTGVHISLPHGMAGVLVSKSGLNVKHNITSTGLIDEGYTGEIIVKLYNHGGYDYEVSAGDKISQLVIVPVLYAGLNPVEDLGKESERGSEGFGSTGR